LKKSLTGIGFVLSFALSGQKKNFLTGYM